MSLFVMVKTVIKSILKKPATVKYPFGPRRAYYKNTRGSIAIDINKCIFCGLCRKKCPTGAISVIKEEKKWKIDRLRCITCGYCIETCPKKCLSMENRYSGPSTGKKEDVYVKKAGEV